MNQIRGQDPCHKYPKDSYYTGSEIIKKIDPQI